MVMEELFKRGIMTMGPSRHDPANIVGVFNKDFAAGLPASRRAAMDTLRWIAGEWDSINTVPATRHNPAYAETGTGVLTLCEKENWICRGREGTQKPHITFDPFSKQYMYVLTEGAYCVLRSPGWQDQRLVFTGHMTMIGVDCEWRTTLTKRSAAEFHYLNEEQLPGGEWALIDEWLFTRKESPEK
jgi:hypothetical protein